MEPTGSLAPPVVAVMVVNEPGEWFDEVLRSLAAQDYHNLRFLFLVVGEAGDLPDRIRDTVPNSFVRAVAGSRGFGTAANEVLRLVEGENGFFCFLHDDVAPDPNAIRLLVEELYRSNAGIVGPKLVEWDRPHVLQHVGLGVDRTGEVDPLVEPGEVDQEQHDAVRDIFAVPSACLLVRADLFRAVGGFDQMIQFHGDDVDLCWRAHLSGARVVVVPAARVRHREGLAERRPDLNDASLAARARARSVLTLTGGRRLWWVVPQLVLVTVAEALVFALTGRFRQAGAALTTLGAALVSVPAVVSRRRLVAPLREVPDTEVAGLQVHGSARLSRFLRARGSRALDPEATNERRWRETAGSAPFLAWLAVIVLFVIGSWRLISGGVPLFAEILAFPSSPGSMMSSYFSGWWGHGLGSTTAVPTGVAIVALGSTATLFHMGLFHTLSVLGLALVGYLGAYRLGSVFPTARARLTLLVVYAAVPLSSQLLSAGRWSALAIYAAVPWALHLLRRIAGIDTYAEAHHDDSDGTQDVPEPRRRRLFAQFALVCGVTIAFAPEFAFVVVVLGLTVAAVTFVIGTAWRAAATVAVASVGGALAGLVLNMPWTFTLVGSQGWTAVVGVPLASPRAMGIDQLAQFAVGKGPLTVLSLALYVPVLVAPLVARSWRFAWAVRAAALVAVFGGLAVLDDRGALPVRMPEPGVMLVPVALGIALACASLAAAFETDVLKGSFGWRQPLGVLSAVCVVVGIVPGVLATGDGSWSMPHRTLQTVFTEFPTDPPTGDYRVLWVGDPSVVPVAGWTYTPGIAYALTDDGQLEVRDHWSGRPNETEDGIATALHQMADGLTVRGGRLLAQYGIRYVIVPVADGFDGTIRNPVQPPAGLVDVLDDQLDLASPLTSPLNYIVYENTAYAPTRATLTPEGAAASELAGDEAATAADLSGSTPFAVGAPDQGPASGDLEAGTLHVAVPVDDGWALRVGDRTYDPRPAFGATMGFDVETAGSATLTYDTSFTRWMWIAFQLIAWGGLVLLATRVRPWRWIAARRGAAALDDTTTVADLSAPITTPSDERSVPWAPDEPGSVDDDVWGDPAELAFGTELDEPDQPDQPDEPDEPDATDGDVP